MSYTMRYQQTDQTQPRLVRVELQAGNHTYTSDNPALSYIAIHYSQNEAGITHQVIASKVFEGITASSAKRLRKLLSGMQPQHDFSAKEGIVLMCNYEIEAKS